MTTDNPRNGVLEKTILDNLNTAVLLFDSDLCLKYINPAGEMLFAVSSRHVLGHKARVLIPWSKEPVEQRLRRASPPRD